MLNVVREIGKLCMFAILWGFPVLLSRWNENNNFLWLFILSTIITVGVFSHYEDLEAIYKIEELNEDNDESDE